MGCFVPFQPLKSPMTLTWLGVRRPDREMDARRAVDLAAVRAELFVGAVQRAFVEEVQIVFGEHA